MVKTYGELVKLAREQHSPPMTRKHLAEKLKVTAPFITDIEKNRRLPSPDNQEKIKKLLVNEQLVKYVLPYEKWQDSYQLIADQYAEIVLDKKNREEYYRACKENRARWVGGGFSVSGAIKGHIAAGAMNCVTGAGHTIRNFFSMAYTSLETSNKMREVFQNPNTRKTLEAGIWNTIFAMHQGLILCIYENTGEKTLLDGSVSGQSTNVALAILKNIPLITNKTRRDEALVEAFNNNPYLNAWYKCVFDAYGDKDGELERLADYLGISIVKNMCPERTKKYEREIRIAMGHLQTVQYIAAISI